MSDRKERKRARTPGHDALGKPNRREVIVVEVTGRPTVVRILQADLVGVGIYGVICFKVCRDLLGHPAPGHSISEAKREAPLRALHGTLELLITNDL